MRFMIIVKATKESEAGVMPKQELFAAMATYHEELAKAGVLLDASGLQASSKGWRVKYSGKKRSVVDGSFTESKELIAGYTMIQVKSREEAVEWTRRFPNPAGEGIDTEIEVRQLFEMDDFEKNEETDRFRKLEVERKNSLLGVSISASLVRRIVERQENELTGLRPTRRLETSVRRSPMKFLSVYRNKERNTPPSPAEMERMGKLVEEGFKSGKLLAVEGCMPSALGARVRQDTGTVTVKDGPFSESKEVIGGLAIIQASSKAEAIEYVREFLLVAGDGECELRQLYEAGGAMPCQDQAAKAQA